MKNSILIVDDSLFNIAFLRKQLGEHYKIISTVQPEKVLEIAIEEEPSLILMDVVMPEVSGYEVCKRLKSNPDTSNIPVIFLTAKGEVEDKVTGLDIGGDDYITKPYDEGELLARIKVHIRLKEAQDQLKKLLEEKNELIEQLKYFSLRDGLTQIYNRKYLEDYLKNSFEESNRYNTLLSVIMMDIDYFKKINDTYGHQTGDEVLIEFTRRIQEKIRKADVLARYGGEEFIVVSKATDYKGAVTLAQKLRKAIKDEPFLIYGQTINVTASFGVSSFDNGDYCNPEQLIKDADILLYKAKNIGGDRVQYK